MTFREVRENNLKYILDTFLWAMKPEGLNDYCKIKAGINAKWP